MFNRKNMLTLVGILYLAAAAGGMVFAVRQAIAEERPPELDAVAVNALLPSTAETVSAENEVAKGTQSGMTASVGAPTESAKATQPVSTAAPTESAKATQPVSTAAPTESAKATQPVSTAAPTESAKATQPVSTATPTTAPAKATQPQTVEDSPLLQQEYDAIGTAVCKAGAATIRRAPENAGASSGWIPENQTCEVLLENVNGWMLIRYRGTVGFVYSGLMQMQ